jgi:hypothetical protein
VTCSVEISNSVIISCSSEWYIQVVNKSNSPIRTPSIVTHLQTRDIIFFNISFSFYINLTFLLFSCFLWLHSILYLCFYYLCSYYAFLHFFILFKNTWQYRWIQNFPLVLFVQSSDFKLVTPGQVRAYSAMFMIVRVLIRCFTGSCNYEICNPQFNH